MRDFKVCHSPVIMCFIKHQVLTLALQRMQTDPPAGVSASPIPDNVMTWYVTIIHDRWPRSNIPTHSPLLTTS